MGRYRQTLSPCLPYLFCDFLKIRKFPAGNCNVRAGLSEPVTRKLAQLAAPQLTYVSCDPSTLARDLRVLIEGGYRVEQAHLVDLFPQTFHIESVLWLAR